MSEHETRLRESLGPSMLHHLEMLLAEKAEEKSRARAEALEEAAKEADAHGVHVTAHNIRRLITTPAPATIPVETVRGVLSKALSLDDDGRADFDEGWACAILHVGGRLNALGMPGASATTPEPPAIPVERVREAARETRRESPDMTEADELALLRRLGVPIDAKGECRVCGAPEGQPHKMSCRPQNRQDAKEKSKTLTPCVCGGRNSRCRMCGGTGFLEDAP